MASKNHDVHMAIYLDGNKAIKTYELLIEWSKKYEEELSKARKAAMDRGLDAKEAEKDPEVKAMKSKVSAAEKLANQMTKSFTDISNAINHMNELSINQLQGYMRFLEKTMKNMSMKGKNAAAELEKRQQQYAQLQATFNERMGRQGNLSRPLHFLLNDLNSSSSSIAQLKALREEFVRFQQASHNMGERNTATQSIAFIDQRLRQMTETVTPLRSLSAMLSELKSKSVSGSIAELKILRDEFVRFQQTSKDQGAVQQATIAIKQLDEQMAKMASLPKRPLTEIMKDVESASKTGSLQQLQLLRAELGDVFKTLTNRSEVSAAKSKMDSLDSIIKNFGKETVDALAVLRNPENFNLSQVQAAITQLESRLANIKVGKTFESSRRHIADQIVYLRKYVDEANNLMKSPAMTQSQAIGFAKGGDGTVSQLKEAMNMLQKYREESIKASDTTKLKEYNQYIDELKKRIDAATSSVSKMDVATAQALANGSITGTISNLKEAKSVLEQFKAGLNYTDAAGLKSVNAEIKAIDERLKEANEDNKKLMDASAARAAVDNARMLIAQARQNPYSVKADDMRAALETSKQAQAAQGISIRLSQEAAAIEREMTDILRGKNIVLMEATTIQKAEADAQAILANGSSAEASLVKETIGLYKQMIQQDGISISKKTEYGATLKKLEDLYRKGAQVRLDAATVERQANDLITAGGGAQVSAIKKSIEELRILAKQEGTTADEAKRYNQTIHQLERLTKAATKSTHDFAISEKEVERVLRNLKSATPEELETAMIGLKNKMKQAEISLKDYVKASVQLRQVTAQMRGVNNEVRMQETYFTKAISKLMQYLGLFGGFYLVRQQLTKAFQANLQYDESLTNIRKTTGLTSESVAMLAENIKRIDTRTALLDMNNLAYAAGKLGVKGVSDVMGFVRASDKIKIALGEQLGDSAEATEQLMKITNIMGVQRQFGLEDALIKTGSAMNYLTMNSQATAQPIVDFMKRIAGVSTQAGVTVSELTGLAGAVSALGQPVEMSATSISKLMVQISSHSKKISEALKMTSAESEEFLYKISSGQMTDALLMVLQKTNEAGGLSHLSTIVKDLGSNGQRVIQTISTLSENYGTVEKMVRMSNNAFEEGTSVTDEYNLKQENTAALWEKLKNNFSKLFVSSDAVNYIRELLISLQTLPEYVRDLAFKLEPLANTFKKVFEIVVSSTNALSGFIGAMFATAALTKIISFLDGCIVGYTKLAAAIKGGETATRRWFAFMKSAQFGNVITAVFAVAFTIINKMRESAEREKRLLEESVEALERTKNQAAEMTADINNSISKLSKTNEGTKERKQLIDELNATYGTYLGHQLTEAMNNEQIADSLRQVNKELRLKALLEGKEQMIQEVENKYRPLRGQKKTDLISTMAERVNTNGKGSPSAARAVASRIVERLLEQQSDGTRFGSTLLRKVESPDGVMKQYLIKETRDANGIWSGYDATSVRTFDNLVASVVKDYNKENNTDFVANGGYVSVMKSLIEYLDVEAKRDLEIRGKSVAWDDDIRLVADQVEARVKSDVEEYWNAIKNTVTMVDEKHPNGKFATEYVGKEDMRPWVDRKNALTTTQRVEEENLVIGFLNRIDDYMRDVAGKGNRYKKDENGNDLPHVESNETDFYKELRARQYNAEEYLKVLKVGKIEDIPDKNKGGKNDPSKDEYADIINKIKAYYELQKSSFELMKIDKKISDTEYERVLKQNEINEHRALRAARLRILSETEEDAWMEARQEMSSQNISGERGEYLLNKVRSVGDVAEIGYNLAKFNTKKGPDDRESNATLSAISKNAEEDQAAIHKLGVEMSDLVLKAWMEQNPIGKVTTQFQQEFEQLGLIQFSDYVKSMMVEVDDQTGELISKLEMREQYAGQSINRIYGNAMDAFLQLGSRAGDFDMTKSDDINRFRDAMLEFPVLAERARNATLEDLQMMYYRAYEYAEQYDEVILKQVEKERNLYERMYSQSAKSNDYKGLIVQYQNLYKELSRLSSFDYSSRALLAQDYAVKRTKLNFATDKWQNNINKATQKRDSKKTQYESETDEGKKAIALQELNTAQEKLDKFLQMPDEVRSATEEMVAAMNTLQDATNEWIGSMVDAFDKFVEGFVPFRSWYEDNGKLASNVFGTKEERQEAFGQFMDDIKKTVREEIKERTKLAVTKYLLQKNQNKKANKLNKEEVKSAKEADKDMEISAETTGAAQMQVDRLVTNLSIDSSKRAKESIKQDNTEEALSGMWGNFGQAMTKAWAVGGPYLGPILAALVSTAVGGLISMVMNMIGHKGTSKAKTKLVPGMLTYDSGNVQSFGPVRTYDSGTFVLGDDGRAYRATRQNNLGTGIVSRPTLTTIGGAPALVGERGPEMVIGRETTAALQMYRPDLMRDIVMFDKNRSRGFAKTFDEGNVQVVGAGTTDRSMTTDEMRQLLTANQAAISQMSQVQMSLIERLNRPINAVVQKNGAGGLVETVAEGFVEARQRGNIKNVTRLFG